jgi:hypothetical protein
MTDKQSILNLQYQTALRELDLVDAKSTPSYILRPAVYPDGNMWCALYGEDLQRGVVGFGETPELACADFDKNWREQRLNLPSRHA